MLTVPISPSADPALKLSELTLSVVEDKASCCDRGPPELASLRTGCVQEIVRLVLAASNHRWVVQNELTLC